MKLAVLLALASIAEASTIQLIGDNMQPGFLEIQIDDQHYEAVRYTGQRGTAQGATWQASVLAYDQLPSLGYYGPRDPQFRYADYLDRYNEFNDLTAQLLTHPEATADIQEAFYWISDPLNPNFHPNAWSDQAAYDASHGLQPDPTQFRYVNSPFIPVEQKAFIFWDEQAGFIVTAIPEPGTLMLGGLALLAIGAILRRN